MGRLLVAERVDQHGSKAIDGIRRLPRGCREVLHREGVEGSIRQGMAVEQEQPGTR